MPSVQTAIELVYTQQLCWTQRCHRQGFGQRDFYVLYAVAHGLPHAYGRTTKHLAAIWRSAHETSMTFVIVHPHFWALREAIGKQVERLRHDVVCHAHHGICHMHAIYDKPCEWLQVEDGRDMSRLAMVHRGHAVKEVCHRVMGLSQETQGLFVAGCTMGEGYPYAMLLQILHLLVCDTLWRDRHHAHKVPILIQQSLQFCLCTVTHTVGPMCAPISHTEIRAF